MPPADVEAYEAEMLATYVETVDLLAPCLAEAGLTPTSPSLRRRNGDDPISYGSEIEMSLLRDGEIDDAFDVVLYVRGQHKGVTRDELRHWLGSTIDLLAKRET